MKEKKPMAVSKLRRPAASLTPRTFQERFERITDNVRRVIKGKDDIIRLTLTALLADGHVLFEDLPGTGKTMLARAIGQTINAEHISRVSCTPDLLPSDITGSPVLDRKSGDFVFRPGPLFANVLLADEVNRATPKTQSALLEAMQERRVTVDGVTYELPKPFLVLATMNPIELAGTFPLPEAQLDRFLMKLSLGYPERLSELEILVANEQKEAIIDLEPIVESREVLEMIDWCARVTVSESVKLYVIDLVNATRSDPSLQIGASTRASLALMRGARVIAASQGRDDVLPDDVKMLAISVMAHRVTLAPDALMRDESVEQVIERIIARVKIPIGLS
ncbi:MAG: AAA family ATPase [Actinomycetota bacterium]|nr:MoxR family ATPase [Actinomycetota bacterium]